MDDYFVSDDVRNNCTLMYDLIWIKPLSIEYLTNG